MAVGAVLFVDGVQVQANGRAWHRSLAVLLLLLLLMRMRMVVVVVRRRRMLMLDLLKAVGFPTLLIPWPRRRPAVPVMNQAAGRLAAVAEVALTQSHLLFLPVPRVHQSL